MQRLILKEYLMTPKHTPFNLTNIVHQNLLPNFSVENIERPICYLRKFTNDGKYLVAFSSDITSLEIFRYQGPAAAAHLLSSVSSDKDYLEYKASSRRENFEIRSKIFDCFFRQVHSIKVTTSDLLHRECSLFTQDNRHIIVASTGFCSENVSYYERYRNNESVPAGSRMQMRNYTFHIVDLVEGKVTDRLMFNVDYIDIDHSHGIYLYKNIFSVLSVLHQTIHIYQIDSAGKFILVRNVGRFCYEDDEYLMRQVARLFPKALPRHQAVSPCRETSFNALKHRLLVFLFNRAKRQSSFSNSVMPLTDYYRNFNQIVSLRMWKMQFLDEHHVLIKYEQEETLTRDITRDSSRVKHINLFAVYNWKSTEVVNVFPQHSEQLLYAYENFCDYFRQPTYPICSMSNNNYARESYEDFKSTEIEKKNGSYREAIRAILTSLPCNAQAFTCRSVLVVVTHTNPFTHSPYLDMSLFSYDESTICSSEKHRHMSDVPIRFHDRATGRFLFRLHTGQSLLPLPPNHPHPANNRRLVAFIFHPFDPFVISVQRYNSHYIVHLHIRHNNPT